MGKKFYGVLLFVGILIVGSFAYYGLQARENDKNNNGQNKQKNVKIPSYFFGNLQVDPRDGWLQLDFRYFSTPGKLTPQLSLYYHSNSKATSSLGRSWFLQADTKLTSQEGGKHLILTRADQNIITFARVSPGKYQSKTGPMISITTTDKGYLVQEKGQGTYLFSPKGHLLKITQGKATLEFIRSKGHLAQMVDQYGRYIRFYYKKGRLDHALDFAGRKLNFRYTKARLSAILDSEGKSHFFRYDKKGRLVGINGGALQIGYNQGDQVENLHGADISPSHYSYFKVQKPEALLVTEKADGLGNITYYQYSNDERTISIMDSLGRSTIYYMNERHLPSKVIYPGFRVYKFHYNKNLQLSKLRDPSGKTLNFRYDEQDNLLSITRADGSKVSFSYDNSGNITTLFLPGQLKYSFTYDSHNRLSTSLTPEGLKTAYSYDGYGYLVSKKDNRNLIETFSYNSRGKLQAMTRGKLKISLTYADRGRKITLKNNLGMTLSAKTNSRGQLEEYTDPRGKKIQYAYNPQGALKSILYPNGSFTSFGYDGLGNMTSLIDPAGRVYAFGYDAGGHQTSKMDPLGRTTKYAFNKMDLPSLITLPNQDKVLYEYDKLERVTQRKAPKENSFFTYDVRGNLKSMKNKDSSYEFSYDSLNRPKVLYDRALKQKLQYTYNGQGLRSSMKGPFGTIRYRYDRTGRIKAVIGPHGEKVSYKYNSQSFPEKVTYPNGVTTSYQYDALGRITHLRTIDSTGKALVKRIYTYKKTSHVSTITNEKGETSKYSYDLRGQLLKVATSTSNIAYKYDSGGNRLATRGQPIRYRYDNTGNRIAVKGGVTTSYAYDRSGRIVLKGKTRYLYDQMGNLTSKIFPQGKVLYSYDSHNKLQSVKLKNGETVRFGYAPNGARVFKKTPQATTRYLYDFEDVVAEFRGGKMVAYYLHGPGIDEPLGMFRRGKKPRYYHTDGLGSVTAMTNKDGAVCAKYAYGPFGEIIQEWGFADDNPYRFNGRWYDSETGLYYYRSRYYDPKDGRFTTPDPLLFGGGVNLYAYVGNDPVNYNDPWGAKRSFWGFVKDVGTGVGLLAGIGPRSEVKAMRSGFVDGLFSKQTLTNTVAFGRGFGKGIWSGVTGVYTTVRHPIRTGKAIYHAIENFDETKAAIGRLIDEYVDAAYNDPERFAEMTGELTGEIVFAIAGTKGLDKLGKLSAITKLKGIAKVGALKNMNRLSRFGNVIKASRVGTAVKRLAPVARFAATGYRKIGGAYLNAAGRKVAPWMGKKIAAVGRGYWKMSKKAAIPTIVAFHDRIETAVNTYQTNEKASSALNGNVNKSLKKMKKSNSTGERERVLRDIDTSFDNYRDFLYKPVHDADAMLKKKLDELADLTNSGEIPDNTAESRLRKFLFEDHPRMRLKALEEVYLKNKPADGYSYINSNGTVNPPSKNRLASYDHQIQLYNYIRDHSDDAKLKTTIEARIKELEKRKSADFKDFLDDKSVDLGEDGISDSPEISTPGAISRLEEFGR